jgi:hypothetical protein
VVDDQCGALAAGGGQQLAGLLDRLRPPEVPAARLLRPVA